MQSETSPSNNNINLDDDLVGLDKDLICSTTPIGDIIVALAKRGCVDLTSEIDFKACSDFPLAGGGFCDVYRGALYNGAKIALKVLRVYDRSGGAGVDSEGRKILKRAARELYHWSRLRHRNVLPLMGLAVYRGHISMTSPWMENGSLVAYLRRCPDVDRLKLCMDICAGLCYIHVGDMVHGDLKAANILVSSDGTALIADFGNAQLKDLTLKFSNTTESSLSVRWTAPELLLADSGPSVSKEADVYAFGMTVLEAFTDQVPYHGVHDNRVIRLVAYENKVPPRPEVGLGDELWNILISCWAREPAERPVVARVSDYLQAQSPSPSKQSLLNLKPKVPPDIPASHNPTTPDTAQPSRPALPLLATQARPKYPIRPNERLAVLLPKDLWKPDHMADECDMLTCKTKFTLFERRHHCRKCGGVFCQACSSQQTLLLDTTSLPFFFPPADLSLTDGPLGPMANSRVCDDCHALIYGLPTSSSTAQPSSSKFPTLPVLITSASSSTIPSGPALRRNSSSQSLERGRLCSISAHQPRSSSASTTRSSRSASFNSNPAYRPTVVPEPPAPSDLGRLLLAYPLRQPRR